MISILGPMPRREQRLDSDRAELELRGLRFDAFVQRAEGARAQPGEFTEELFCRALAVQHQEVVEVVVPLLRIVGQIGAGVTESEVRRTREYRGAVLARVAHDELLVEDLGVQVAHHIDSSAQQRGIDDTVLFVVAAERPWVRERRVLDEVAAFEDDLDVHLGLLLRGENRLRDRA